MDYTTASQNLKAFRTWVNGPGKKYFPKTCDILDLRESLKTACATLDKMMPPDQFMHLVVGASATLNRWRTKKRDILAKCASEEEKLDFTECMQDLDTAVKSAKRILRAIDKAK